MAILGTLYYFLPFHLLVAVEAYTVFQPVCSKPTTSVNFVSTSGSRSALGILWNSLFTIFACMWAIQHSNVPEQRKDQYPGCKGDVLWELREFYNSAKLAFLTVAAPEVVIMSATSDLIQSHQNCRVMNEKYGQD